MKPMGCEENSRACNGVMRKNMDTPIRACHTRIRWRPLNSWMENKGDCIPSKKSITFLHSFKNNAVIKKKYYRNPYSAYNFGVFHYGWNEVACAVQKTEAWNEVVCAVQKTPVRPLITDPYGRMGFGLRASRLRLVRTRYALHPPASLSRAPSHTSVWVCCWRVARGASEIHTAPTSITVTK